MSEEAAFENAILASPNDDTVRLVFADWLDERVDARGRFLRAWFALRQASEALDSQFEDITRRAAFDEFGSTLGHYQQLADAVDRNWLWRFGAVRAWITHAVGFNIIRQYLRHRGRNWQSISDERETEMDRAWMFSETTTNPSNTFRKRYASRYLVHKFLGQVEHVGSPGAKCALWSLEGRP